VSETLRHGVLASVLAILSLTAAQASQATPAVDREAWSRHAETELEQLDELVRGRHASGAWRRLHALYRECPSCCRNSADESFGWIPATLLADHWSLRGELFALVRSNPEWFDFVLASLHGPIDSKLLRRAAVNTKRCPVRSKRDCERIKVNALEAAKAVESQ